MKFNPGGLFVKPKPIRLTAPEVFIQVNEKIKTENIPKIIERIRRNLKGKNLS